MSTPQNKDKVLINDWSNIWKIRSQFDNMDSLHAIKRYNESSLKLFLGLIKWQLFKWRFYDCINWYKVVNVIMFGDWSLPRDLQWQKQTCKGWWWYLLLDVHQPYSSNELRHAIQICRGTKLTYAALQACPISMFTFHVIFHWILKSWLLFTQWLNHPLPSIWTKKNTNFSQPIFLMNTSDSVFGSYP